MINNIVEQVLSYKKAQFEEIMNNPRSFVQQSANETNVFLQQLESVQVNTNTKEDAVPAAGPVDNQIEEKEWARRFSSPVASNENTVVSSSQNDKWNVIRNYTVQPIQAKYKNMYIDIIGEISEKYKIPAGLIQKMIETESSYNPNAVSSAGARGLMQLMPANIKEQGVTNANDPRQNIEAGVKEISGYLSRYNGDLVMALAAYNAGPGNVKKYGGVPPFKETERYIQKILNIKVR